MTQSNRFTDRLAVAIARVATRSPWLVLAAALVVMGLMASGAGRLELVNNYRVFFGENNPELITFDRFQNTFAKNDNLLFVVVRLPIESLSEIADSCGEVDYILVFLHANGRDFGENVCLHRDPVSLVQELE